MLSYEIGHLGLMQDNHSYVKVATKEGLMLQLLSDRLTIRPSAPEDLTDECVVAHNNLALTKYTELRHRIWTRELLEQIFAHSLPLESELYSIVLKGGGNAIGNIRLSNFDLRHRRVEIGIFLWRQSVWGQGIGTEALLLMEGYCFDECKLHRIGADYYAPNKASKRMFEKANYQLEGVLKDFYSTENSFIDAVRVAKIIP